MEICDAVIAPSRHTEGYLTGSGLPVVESDGGALPETTENLDGIYRFKPGDISSLTKTIRRTIEDIDEPETAECPCRVTWMSGESDS